MSSKNVVFLSYSIVSFFFRTCKKIMDKDDLMLMKFKDFKSQKSLDTLFRYLEISEHYIFTGEIRKAKSLLRNLGFNEKTIKKYINGVDEKYDDWENQKIKEIILGKINKNLLN